VLVEHLWVTHFVVVLGGEKQHRWRADDQKMGGRRARGKIDGRGIRKGKTMLTSTTRRVGLLNVHGRARCPSRGWYAKEPHDKGEKAVGFMVSTTTGTGGG
jgi:hypothetical protein